MEYDIGKIRNFDIVKGYGDIVSNNDVYTFLVKDLDSKDRIKNGDLVSFRKEKINNINRAFFINKIDKYRKERKK